MTQYYNVEGRVVRQVLDPEAGDIGYANDCFSFEIGTGIGAVTVVVQDWDPSPVGLDDRLRAVAAAADAMWNVLCEGD